MASTKKLTNNLETLVDESLIGFAAANPLTRKLQNYRVLVRSDLDDYGKSGKIALVSGGGSGHEPMFAGFVGEGCLTASVAGSVFTSPPPMQILAALNAIKNPSGILVFIANYTGDRLNFGIAIERFTQSNDKIPVKSIVIADDCAMTSKDKSAGRRGLSGIVFVLKISGAMADLGFSLEDVAKNAEAVVTNMGTIGLSLSSCSLPGSGPIFSLGDYEMELGLGVHGEPGVERVKLKTAKETVDMMLKHLIDSSSATHLPLQSRYEIAVLLNNLGGLTQLEINLLCKEILDWFENKNIVVKRFYFGTFMTSLEMQGFSISVLKIVEKDWYKYLDAKTNCSAWSKGQILDESFKFSTSYSEIDDGNVSESQTDRSSRILGTEVENDLYKCLLSICNDLIENESYLNKLDQSCGDGDCGTTMKSGASAIKKSLLNFELSCNEPHICLQQISTIWENSTGGTAGAIYSLFLSSISKSLKNNSAGFLSWLKALCDGTSTIMKYSGAQTGDRTMVDPLSAAAEIAQQYIEKQSSLDKEFFHNLLTAVEGSANSTTGMTAKAGRASYVAKSNLTMPDPGAMVVYIWIKSIADYYLKIV